MTPLERIRIEKAAADCGFERKAISNEKGQLELRSAVFPEFLCVELASAGGYKITSSAPALLNPHSMTGTVQIAGIEQLYKMLQHAAVMASAMPSRVVDVFRAKTQNLPKNTEAERMVVQRVGQDIFRNALLDFWQGRCCVSGLAIPSLLRASHIKPWALCASDNERLDAFNGLLLAPNLDALFDGGWISFSGHGTLLVSNALPTVAKVQLGISEALSVQRLTPAHSTYLDFHRAVIFKKLPNSSTPGKM